MTQSATDVAAVYAEILNRKIKIKSIGRTMLDTIDVLKHRSKHLTKKEYIKWLNRDALRKFSNRDYINTFDQSDAVKKVFAEAEGRDLNSNINLICEHVVPCAKIIEYLQRKAEEKNFNLTADDVLTAHDLLYRRCIITKDEDQALNDAGYNRKMPNGWNFGDNPYNRYLKVGFKWAKKFN